MMRMKRWLLASLVFCPLSVGALEPNQPTPAELAMLPQFCTDRLTKGAYGKGVASAEQLGHANFLHIHHYCTALNYTRRAVRKVKAKDRNYDLERAKANYTYVIRATEPTFWMRPQIYTEFGKVLLQLKEGGEAARWFNEAIQFNREYEPAYLALIDIHRQTQASKEGREVAAAGLRYLPASTALKKAYLDFGGKEPFPEPVAKQPPTEPPKADSPPETSAKTEGANAAEASPAASNANDVSAPRTEQSPTSGAPATGSNCRFCVPEETQRKWRESFNSPNK
jgi:hypothetical protein